MEISVPGFILYPEPDEKADPWSKLPPRPGALPQRVKTFLKKPIRSKYLTVAQKMRLIIPKLPIPLRLPFGAWWIAQNSALDCELMTSGFENAETRFVQAYLKPGMTVLDVGAHHGLYTLLAARCVGHKGRVIACEPSPRERERLMRHVRLNWCNNVQVEPIALGNERLQTDLFVVEGGDDWCNSLRPPAVSAGTKRVKVEVFTLSDLAAKRGIGTVDFLKLDVEGGELGVLQGARSFLEGPTRPVLLVEVYDIRTQPWNYRAHEIVHFLDRLSYRWFSLLKDGSIQSISPALDVYDANLVALPNERVDEILHSLGVK
jgi:FkbM family methyltransferase